MSGLVRRQNGLSLLKMKYSSGRSLAVSATRVFPRKEEVYRGSNWMKYSSYQRDVVFFPIEKQVQNHERM